MIAKGTAPLSHNRRATFWFPSSLIDSTQCIYIGLKTLMLLKSVQDWQGTEKKGICMKEVDTQFEVLKRNIRNDIILINHMICGQA